MKRLLTAGALIALVGAMVLLSIRASRTEIVSEVATSPVYAESVEVVETPKPEPKPAETAPVTVTELTLDQKIAQNINDCEPTRISAEDATCLPELQVAPVATEQTTEDARPSVGGGDCATEIAKYDWDQATALAVAQAESSMNPSVVNDNPATGDYSVGCFQINLYGANAYSRPSEAALKNAATNVAFAYQIYSANGKSWLGQWGVCRTKVACY